MINHNTLPPDNLHVSTKPTSNNTNVVCICVYVFVCVSVYVSACVCMQNVGPSKVCGGS